MFDLLKKKLSSFTEKLKKTIEKKGAAQQPAEQEKTAEATEQAKAAVQARAAEEREEPKTRLAAELQELTEEEQEIERELKEADKKIEKSAKEKKAAVEKKQAEKEEPVLVAVEAKEEPAEQVQEDVIRTEEKKRELKTKVGIAGKIKSVFRGFVELNEKDIAELLDELELALLEADVEQDTAAEITREIRKELVGKKIPSGKNLNELVKEEIKKALQKTMAVEKKDLLALAEKKKPFVILFLGPNGAGKTTTIAKLTFLLQGRGKSVVWAAADTFRAASIEQLEKHAEKLKVRMIKHKYGADPAAVAFDAVKAAEAACNDFVLIDSAGRQETNRNLMEELKKIVRVAKPDLKIYVGESFTGQALLQQALEFNAALGIDGFVLTKIDCDSKGGTTISLLYKTKKPVLFVGTGQEYKDLLAFDPEFVLEKII